MIRNLFGGSKCRTVDVCDIFGDNSGKALYRLDGNANDESGNYHGTETAITYGGGAYERGAVFNGSSSQIATSITPISFAGVFAVSLWCNTSRVSDATYDVLFATAGYSSANAFVIFINTTGNIALYFGAALTITGTITVTDGKYHHISVLRESDNTVRLYVDGVADGSVVKTGDYTGARIALGWDNSANTQYLGSIDQVRIFNRAITATEEATLYAECAPTSTVDNINPFEDGSLKALYQFNGDATDKTGVYNGTATNVTYGTGKFGQCAVFNGTSSKVAIGNLGGTISADVSVSFFMSNFVYSSIGEPFIDLRGTGGYGFALVTYTGGVFRLYGNGEAATSVTIPTGAVFNHIVLTVTGQNCKIYVNGEFKGVFAINVRTAYAGNNFLGTTFDDSGVSLPQFNCDQVRIFNKALTPMEVASLYNETTPLEEPMHSLVDPFKDGSGKALYRLDGNALDESGNYNGTETAIAYGGGVYERGAVFNGSSSKISTSKIISAAQTFSLSMWVKISSAAWSSGGQMIAMSYDNDEWFLNVGTFGLVWHTYTNTGATVNITYTTVNTEWMHVVCISQPNGVQALYINGVLFQSVAYNYTGRSTALTNVGHHFGFNVYTGTQWFNGSQDQVRIFNRALTASEVQTLYTEI